MSKEKLLMAIGGIVPFAVLALSLLGYISYDMAIAAILFMFAPALFPALIENYRKKQGWSKVSTVTTTAGQAAIGVIFVVMGLTISVVITAFLTLVWGILMVQAFMYAKKETPVTTFDPDEWFVRQRELDADLFKPLRLERILSEFPDGKIVACDIEHECGCENPVGSSASEYM